MAKSDTLKPYIAGLLPQSDALAPLSHEDIAHFKKWARDEHDKLTKSIAQLAQLAKSSDITKSYTVATLPTGQTTGTKFTVTDATAPTFLGTLTGGGTVVCTVTWNGTAWKAG